MSTKEKAKALMSKGWKGAKEKTRAARGVLSHLAKHKRFKLPTATRDTEYETASRAFLETVTVLEKARRDLNTFLGSVRTMCLAFSELGQDFVSLGTGADANTANAFGEYSKAMTAMDDSLRRSVDEEFIQNIIGTLDAKIEAVKMIKDDMAKRKDLKYEYDYYVGKVRSLKEKASTDPSRLPRNEAKLVQSQGPMEQATAHLMAVFHHYETERHLLLRNEFLSLRRTQQHFFSTAATTMDGLRAEPSRQALTLGTYTPFVFNSAAAPARTSSVSSIPSLGGSTPRSSYGGGPSGAETRGRLVRFYQRYNPEKLGEVDTILAAYVGHEEELFAQLTAKYGAEPPAPSAAAAAAPSTAVSKPGFSYGGYADTADPGVGAEAADPTSYSTPRGIAAASAPSSGAGVAMPGLVPAGGANNGGGSGERAKVLYDYAAQDTDELSLVAGQVVSVLKRGDDGWWYGELNGQRGVFPGNYVEVV